MGQRKVTFALGEYYHLYNRGTDKRDIYLDVYDYQRFTELLYLCNTNHPTVLRDIHRDFDSVYTYDREQTLVSIGAYCLMPNHFHLLITPMVEDGVAKFMNKLGTSYSIYFNRKYDRSGSLFQGRFKAKMVVEDQYMKYLFAYIHLNPVKLIDSEWKEKGIRNFEETINYLQQYIHSSLPNYLKVEREENKIIEETHFPEYFPTAASNLKELSEWLSYLEFEST